MKKNILTFALTGVMAMTGFALAAQESLKAMEERADIESYRKEAAEKIEANNRSIAEFNARVQHEKNDVMNDYKNRIAALEQKIGA